MRADVVTPQLGPMVMVRPLDSLGQSDLVRVIVQSDGPGVVERAPTPGALVAIHVGRPVRLDCRHGAERHAGLAIHGDIELVPAGMPARWEMTDTDTALALILSPGLLGRAAAESDAGRTRVDVRSRFQVRDPQIEHIAWALKAEVEQDYPNGTIFMDSLATALAVRVMGRYGAGGIERLPADRGLPPRKLRFVLSYIDEHLREDLRLHAIATAAGLSVSHLKVLFRRSVGLPVHQYVVQRRISRAVELLRQDGLPISQVALEVGFAHQSHLAMHMRRLLGITPLECRRR